MKFVNVRGIKMEVKSGYTYTYVDYETTINTSHIVRIEKGKVMKGEEIYNVYLSNMTEPLFIIEEDAQKVLDIISPIL